MPYIYKHDIANEMNQKKTASETQLVAEATEEEYKIETLIRERYSMSQETALHRKKLMGTLSDEEWNEYTTFIEACVAKAREETNN